MVAKAAAKRCAIYVRKSSEEGLEMSYNSLEAQADACSAYIASQHHEGWAKLPKVYQDGGYSGGNLERPGLQELFSDVAAGRIDIIVVYKIDRLTRSLTDFAKLNDLLDRHNVSFVAVTQQFNTSTSMGRLTLNVLLSFAQFEREVAGERIRDKVAASKKKGMWMGGAIPLGYAVSDRKLVTVEEEAKVVRRMFARYLELRSVNLLQQELEQQGVRTRVRTTKSGHTLGGFALGRGAIAHMLKNPLYIGCIRYKDELYSGQHDAIINRETFDAVQAALHDHAPNNATESKRPTASLLQGILIDGNGNRMVPSFCKKRGIRYHYYTSIGRLKAVASDPMGLRVPAGDLERVVVSAVSQSLQNEKQMHDWLTGKIPPCAYPEALGWSKALAGRISVPSSEQPDEVRSIIDRVQVSKEAIEIRLSASGMFNRLGLSRLLSLGPDEIDSAATSGVRHAQTTTPDYDEPVLITVKSHLLRCGKQTKLVIGQNTEERTSANPQLVEMLVRARRWFEGLVSGYYSNLAAIAKQEQCDKSHVSRLISIAFLSPVLVERILRGDHSATLTPERLRKACPLPLRWADQHAALMD